MPITSPPLLTPFVAPGPNHGQEEEEFNVNQQNFVDSQFNNVTEQNALAAWHKATADFVEERAGAAEESKNNAALSETSAADDAGRAEEAAATAQAAAGLPPLASFGRVIHTEGIGNLKTAAFTAETSTGYDIDSTTGGFPITAPFAPKIGDWFWVRFTHKVSIARRCIVIANGSLIMGKAANMQLSMSYKLYFFEYRGPVLGWRMC